MEIDKNLRSAMEMNVIHMIHKAEDVALIEALYSAFNETFARYNDVVSAIMSKADEMDMGRADREGFEAAKGDLENMRDMRSCIEELYALWKETRGL